MESQRVTIVQVLKQRFPVHEQLLHFTSNPQESAHPMTPLELLLLEELEEDGDGGVGGGGR